jgi:hypothetical protein
MMWIDRKAELPPSHEDFIALNRDGRIFRSRMCYGMHEPWFTYPQGDRSASDTMPAWLDVTHWMPLPPPPAMAPTGEKP